MRDKEWRDGLARKTYVAVLEVMSRPAPKSGDGAQPKSALELTGAPSSIATDPVIDSYRRRLSMIVF